MHCIPFTFSQCFMHLDVCLSVENCVLIGWIRVSPWCNFFSTSHIYAFFSCIHTLSFLSICSRLWLCSFLSLSLSLSRIDYAWHPSANLLWLGTLFVSGYLLPLILPFPPFTFSSLMRKLIRNFWRTFLNVAFIRSTMWFYRTFSILLFSMSFTLGDGNLFVRYPWGVPPCSYKSFTPTCTISIPLCLNLSRHSEVHVS